MTLLDVTCLLWAASLPQLLLHVAVTPQLLGTGFAPHSAPADVSTQHREQHPQPAE